MAGDFSNISLFNVQVEISVRLHEMVGGMFEIYQ